MLLRYVSNSYNHGFIISREPDDRREPRDDGMVNMTVEFESQRRYGESTHEILSCHFWNARGRKHGGASAGESMSARAMRALAFLGRAPPVTLSHSPCNERTHKLTGQIRGERAQSLCDAFACLCGVHKFVDCYTQIQIGLRHCTSARCLFLVVFFLTVRGTHSGSIAPHRPDSVQQTKRRAEQCWRHAARTYGVLIIAHK